MKKLLYRLLILIRFIPIYLYEMTLSNFRVAFDVLRPKPKFLPGFVTISLKGYGDLERWGAMCLISMTPGTLALDIEHGSDELLVHSLYLDDPEATRRDLEKLVARAFGNPLKH